MPTPKGYTYIGRNHPFVETLSRNVINDSVNGGDLAACRAMVIETADVSIRTTIMMMRVRSVIRDKKQNDHELVGEEMIFVGYRGNIENHEFLPQEDCKLLFLEATASGNTDIVSQKQHLLERAIDWTYDINTLSVGTPMTLPSNVLAISLMLSHSTVIMWSKRVSDSRTRPSYGCDCSLRLYSKTELVSSQKKDA